MAPRAGDDDPAVYRSGTARNAADDSSDSGEDDDDGALLTVQAGFNRLLLVLRDEGVMRFVKYISAAAPGSRWDVCGEYAIGMIQKGSDDDVVDDEK